MSVSVHDCVNYVIFVVLAGVPHKFATSIPMLMARGRVGFVPRGTPLSPDGFDPPPDPPAAQGRGGRVWANVISAKWTQKIPDFPHGLADYFKCRMEN